MFREEQPEEDRPIPFKGAPDGRTAIHARIQQDWENDIMEELLTCRKSARGKQGGTSKFDRFRDYL